MFKLLKKLPLVFLLLIYTLHRICTSFHNSHRNEENLLDEFTAPHHLSRELLVSLPNCTPPAIEQFPRTLMTPQMRSHGGVILHIIVAAYTFLALAIVCDEYFVPACEKICEVLKLESDVAGATFMAAGSSAPELATSVIGVFIAKDDIGLGTVVGSAVFNIMFVIGICALFSGAVVYLHWWPLFRDSMFYTISILALVLCIFDEKVYWYEALCLLILYAIYLLIMVFNPRLEAWIIPKFSCCKNTKPEECTELTPEACPTQTYVTSHEEQEDSAIMPSHIGVPSETIFTPPTGCFKKFLWAVGLPVSILFFITIPDCRKDRWQKWWVVTFVMSCVWIGAYSYLMVWMITVAGYTIGIPDTIMGLTFIAAGASVPDAIASLLVAQDGLGDMAVSNAVGSNVFDILLCLGLPYFFKSVIAGGAPVPVYSEGLTYSSLTLLTTVIFLLVSVHINGWKLDKKYGVILMVVYIFFNILAVLYELNIFGYNHAPTCLTDF